MTNALKSRPTQAPDAQGAAPRWRDVLPVHPAAELFPLLSKDELRELAEDIKNNGLLEQIVLYDDPKSIPCTCVLDGRNRLDALELIGRKTVNINGDLTSPIFTRQTARKSFDPVAYAISKNIHRRHLTSDQKRELIAKVLKAKPETSNNQIAKQVKVDDKTVAKVRTKLESTSEIPKLEKTKGKDGKERPAKKPKAKAPDKAKPKAPKWIDDAEQSSRALAEFSFACHHWLPQITVEADRDQAIMLFADFYPDAKAAERAVGDARSLAKQVAL